MHNFVNQANGKKKLSYQEALEELEKNPNYIRNALFLSLSVTALVLLSVKFISKIKK
jgi:hypothetical protein